MGLIENAEKDAIPQVEAAADRVGETFAEALKTQLQALADGYKITATVTVEAVKKL